MCFHNVRSVGAAGDELQTEFFAVATPKPVLRSKALSAAAKVLYAALLELCGPKRKHPIRDRELIEATGLSRRTVINARANLARIGLVDFTSRDGRAGGVEYRFFDPVEVLNGAKSAPIEAGNGAKSAVVYKEGQPISDNHIPDGRKSGASEKRPKKNKAKHGAEVHRLYGEVCKGHKQRFGGNPDKDTGGAWRGILSRCLSNDFSEIDLGRAIGIWFRGERGGYGPELFVIQFRGRRPELWGQAMPPGRARPADGYATAAESADARARAFADSDEGKRMLGVAS